MSRRFPFGARAQLAVTVMTALVAVSLALPWAASGRRTRTGWELGWISWISPDELQKYMSKIFTLL